MTSRLGINEKSEFIKNLLGQLAYADFYHDFGDPTIFDNVKEELSNIIGGENIIKYIESIIATPVGGSKYTPVKDKSKSKSVKKKPISVKPKKPTPVKPKKPTPVNTVYQYFKATDLLTPTIEKLDDKYLKEDKILDTILGNNVYKDIKEILKKNEEKYFKGDNDVSLPKDIPLNINIGEQIRRNYKVSAYPTKNNGEYYNLPYSYREVSNNSNFILLIDSSFFSFSSLRDENIILKIIDKIGEAELNPTDINRSYTFYIIKNIENLADSATKISLFNKGNQRIKIKILKDKIGRRIQFPAYNNIQFTQNVNYFSSIELNTEKNEEEIQADANYPTLPKKHYKNISFLGSRNKAALNALIESYKSNYNPFNGEKKGDEDKKLQTLIYLLLKRFGDWSQALSLLDRERMYEIYDYDTDKIEGETTLNQLKMKEKADIALVTHDRILLAYSILLGLNVFYSLKTKETKETKKRKKREETEETEDNSTIWNIYFKNSYDTIEIDRTLYNKLSSQQSLVIYIQRIEGYIKETDNIYKNIINELNNIILEMPEDIVYNTVNSTVEYRTTFTNPLLSDDTAKLVRKEFLQENPRPHILFFQEFIVKLRKVLTKLSNITLSETIVEELKKLKEIYDEIKSNINKNHLYKVLDEIYYNIEHLYTINTKLHEMYTDEEEQKNDKNVIEDYFNYITNYNVSILQRKDMIKKYEKLLTVIGNNYIICKKILPDNKIFVNGIIPTIDVLYYNNIYIGNIKKRTDITKNNICRFLKELRNKVTPVGKKKDDMSEDNVKISSSDIVNNKVIQFVDESTNSSIMYSKVEGPGMLEYYHSKAVVIAIQLRNEGKPYKDVYVPFEIPPAPADALNNSSTGMNVEDNSRNMEHNHNNEESMNPQNKNRKSVNSRNMEHNDNNEESMNPQNKNRKSVNLQQELTQPVGQELTQDLGQELTQPVGQELTQPVGQEDSEVSTPEPEATSNKILVENGSQSGGYIIKYIYDGNGNFRSTISVEEKNPIKKFILFYLDSLYSRLFSLKQYSNGGDDNDYPSFDENIYEQYLIIYKELISIDLFLETSNLKELRAIYNKKRYQWKGADLKPYMRELNGGLNEVDDKLHKYYEELHKRVRIARITIPTKATVTTATKNVITHKINSKHHTRRKRRTNPINQTRRNNRRVV